MKIAFDAQLLFENQKTGIGWTADNLIKNIIKESDNEYFLNYFSLRRNKYKEKIVQEYKNMGYKINKCGWFPNVIYRNIWNHIPIPYSLFFGKQAQIIQFFNYDIPPGVEGRAVTFIYDMVYKAFPETISKETMEMLNYNLAVTCRRADRIITISEFSKSEIIKYLQVPEDKISIIPCGVDLSIYHPNYTPEEVEKVKKKYGIDSDYILYMGTLEPRKNIERLIEAYKLLQKEAGTLPKLILAGKKGWMYEKIFNKVEEYRLKEKVIFTDYVESRDVPILMKGALMFVFPSIYEGFGIPPLEAMACGTPVVVSNTASLPEVVGEAGYYVDPYSKEEMKNAMQVIIGDKTLQKEMSKNGLYRARSFTWKSSAETLLKIYEHL